jgi:phosphoribosylformimino-5-aminoimidazole carboxamide ribonucleotide (ProFAR) isomerase
MEYDRLNDQVDAATRRLADEKKKEDPDKTICTNLEGLITKHGADIEQLKKQMDGYDSQIEDAGGITETIEGLKMLKEMLKEFYKKQK